MTERSGNQIDYGSLPDDELKLLISTSLAAAHKFAMGVATFDAKLIPLLRRVETLSRERRLFESQAKIANDHAKQLQEIINQRRRVSEQTEVNTLLLNRIRLDAEKAGKSSKPIAKGLSRVLTYLLSGDVQKEQLDHLFDPDKKDSQVSRRIWVKIAGGDSVFVRINSKDGYQIGYNINDQTPASVRESATRVHDFIHRIRDFKDKPLQINRNFIGLEVAFFSWSDDVSVAVQGAVLGEKRDNGEAMRLLSTMQTADTIADYLGSILLAGDISLPKP